MTAELDLERLLKVLDRNGVAYVMIGGMAAVIHGSPFPTEDVDITPAPAQNNLGRLSVALHELGARARVRTDLRPEDRPGVPLGWSGAVASGA